MKLNYDFNEEDHFHWYQYSIKASPIARKARRRYVVRWFALYVCVATAIVFCIPTYTAAFIGYGLAIVLTFTALRDYDQRLDAAIKEVAAADPQRNGNLGQHQLTLSDVGMREVTPTTDTTVEWEKVIDALRYGDYVFVLVSTKEVAAAAVISRRSYSGPVPFDEIPQAIQDLKQKKKDKS